MNYPNKYQQQGQQALLQAEEREWSKQRTSDRSYLHTYQAGAFLPFIQALLIGLMIGITGTIAAVVLAAPKPLLWGLGILCTISTIILILLIIRWLKLTAPIEISTGWETEQQGLVGYEGVRIELKQDRDGYPKTQLAYFDQPREKMQLLAAGLESGLPLTQAAWTGRGKPFSRAAFEEIRSEMIKHGWARWRNPEAPSQGMELSKPGQAVIKFLHTGHQEATHPLNGQVDVIDV